MSVYRHGDTKAVRRQRLLSGIFEGKLVELKGYQQLLEAEEIPVNKRFYRVVVSAVFGETVEERKYPEYLLALFGDILKRVQTEYVWYNSWDIFILCMNQGGASGEEDLQCHLEQICKLAQTRHKINVSFYVGHEVYSMKDVLASYRSALAVYERSLEKDDARQVYMDALTLAGADNRLYLEEMHLMLSHLLDNEFMVAEQILSKVFETYEKERRPWKTAADERRTFFRNVFIETVEAAITNNAQAIESYFLLQKDLEGYHSFEYIHRVYQQMAYLAEEAVHKRQRNLWEPAAEIKAYIDTHYQHQNLSLALISEQMGLSMSYVSRLFKNTYGNTVLEYITAVRLQEACTLLQKTNMTVKDIAGKVGYAIPVTFSRAFQKKYGVSPEQWRKR